MAGCCLERKPFNKEISNGNKVMCFINGMAFSGQNLTQFEINGSSMICQQYTLTLGTKTTRQSRKHLFFPIIGSFNAVDSC